MINISVGVFMGILHVKIDDEVERRFRIAVLKVKGSRKGVLGEAVEEAILLWLEKHEEKG